MTNLNTCINRSIKQGTTKSQQNKNFANQFQQKKEVVYLKISICSSEWYPPDLPRNCSLWMMIYTGRANACSASKDIVFKKCTFSLTFKKFKCLDSTLSITQKLLNTDNPRITPLIGSLFHETVFGSTKSWNSFQL